MIDVPAVDGQPAFSRLYGTSAIYSLTPVTEEIAMRAAEQLRERPVTVYMPALPAPSGGPDWDDSDDEIDFDEDDYDDD